LLDARTKLLDARTNEWLGRLQSNAPRLVSVLLATLIVVELGQIGYAFFTKPLKTPQPIASGFVPRPQRPGVDIESVISAHLFGTVVIDPATQDPATAPQSSANLQLAGTIATQDPKRGVAIVSDGGPSKVYSVGDRIGGASLHSVYLDRIVLDRAGVLETVMLPRLLLTSSRGPVSRPGDAATVAAVDNIRHMVQQDPGILDQVMRVVASYDNNAGKLRGFRAYPGRNRQIFGKLGLKPGDLVTAINGTPLDDPQHSQDVFNTIQSSDHVTVTVERGGQKQDIMLNIAQVAAQATQALEADPSAATPGTAPPGAPPGGNMPLPDPSPGPAPPLPSQAQPAQGELPDPQPNTPIPPSPNSPA
jgi:general secretion pathway protein C